MPAALIRHLFAKYRRGLLGGAQMMEELGIARTRFYELYGSYLRACAKRQGARWSPACSGGVRRAKLTPQAQELLIRLLGARPPCSYRFAASELSRRFKLGVDSATVSRFARAKGIAPPARVRRPTPAWRRWQMQDIGALWQLDVSPHRWFVASATNLPLFDMLDDCSRLITGARIYGHEVLMAYLDFVPACFKEHGLPLVLYVDYHSFFFSSRPDALTALGRALRFYDVALRYAPTPQAKGKIERLHLFWQNRLPALLAAEGISEIQPANALLDELRRHHNAQENHRELRMTPQRAWSQAKEENRCVLRPAPACPWWAYIWSQRSSLSVGSDGCVHLGASTMPFSLPKGSKVLCCRHPNGDISLLKNLPSKTDPPQLLARLSASHTTRL